MSSIICENYQLHSSGGSRARAAAAKSGSADAFLKTILQTAQGKECAAQLANRGDYNAALSAISMYAGGHGAKLRQAAVKQTGISDTRLSDTQASKTEGVTEAGGASKTEGVTETGGASKTEAVSLEDMLRAKYPNLAYHVLDASSSDWRTRNDYPHYLLYQDNARATEMLKNWKPSGPNPKYTPFEAPKEIHALSSVPPGSKAVAIHPKVQERMEEDPEYAKEIFQRIEAWFALDIARNEAIMPGCTADMAQSIAIGEDGSIVNVQASSPGRITYSKSGSDKKSGWELRMERHAYFMELWINELLERAMQHAYLNSGSVGSPGRTGAGQMGAFIGAGTGASTIGINAGRLQLADMLAHGNLKEIFGDTVAGTPTDKLLAQSKALAQTGQLIQM